MDSSASTFPSDAPLRLEIALKAAFPAGGMTVAGLRREIARGRLDAELIAGKYFVTLAGIAEMRKRCLVQRGAHGGRDDDRHYGSLSADASRSPQAALDALLQSPSRKKR